MDNEATSHNALVQNRLKIYKNIIDNAQDIILLFTTEGRIVDANGKAVKTYGYAYDELLELSIFDLRNPYNADLVREQYEKARIEGNEFETQHFRKDGTTFPVEVKAIGINDGNDSYIVSIIRDITNRRKKEEEIRKLASIVESSEDAILGKTIDGIITSWNRGAEKLYGYIKQEVIGKHISMIIPEKSEEDIEIILDRIKNNEKIEYYETTRKRKDGQIVHVSISVSPIYDVDGNIIGASTIARDLTERYALTRKLNEHEEKWKLANELLVANTFQTSLMFSTKRFELADMYGKYIPCSMVGGDLYDCIETDESLWFIIADVAGHGLVAAMVSTMLKGVFNNSIHNCTYPNEVLENMNTILCKTIGDYDASHLVSAFVGVIRGDRLYYSNAGHPYPVMLDLAKKETRVLGQNSFLLGMQRETKYILKQTDFSKEDILLLYTDGLFNLRKESSPANWEQVSSYSLMDVDLFKINPQAYIDELLGMFQQEYGRDFDDDVSIMLIHRL